MKKLSKIIACLVLFVFGLCLVACGDPRTKEEKNFTYPTSADATLGNGGLAVQKGNYLYYVNGFNSVVNAVNKEDTYVVGSLMLMKLGENGEIVTNENGLLNDSFYITMNSKLCGYQATNLFIYGEYLYFVSPCNENETGDEVWAKDRVVFNRIKLDKSSEVEEIYQSGVKYNNLEYQYYVVNGNLNILTWEKGDCYYEDYGKNALIKVDVNSKSNSVVSNDVEDMVFAKDASQIFFKTTVSNKHSLKRYNMNSGEVIDFITNSSTDFDLIAVADNQVFISQTHSTGSSTDKDVYSYKISNKTSTFIVADSWSSTINVTSDGVVLLIKDNHIRVVRSKDNIAKITVEGANSINVIDYTNGCVLFYDTTSENSNLKLVSYSNVYAGSEAEVITLTTISTVEKDYAYFDFSEDENMLYFYKKEVSNYYLHRIKVNYNSGETEEMVGVYLDGDAPVIEESEEEIEE